MFPNTTLRSAQLSVHRQSPEAFGEIQVALVFTDRKGKEWLAFALECGIYPDVGLESCALAYSGEREHSFRLNVNTFFFNALPTEVFTPGVHVQSIS